MKRRSFAVAAFLAILLALSAMPAAAQITRNTIDPEASLSPSGRYVSVSGPIACGEGQTLRLSAFVVQGSTMASGSTQLACSGRDQIWRVYASTGSYSSTFEEGPAQSCAIGMVYSGRMLVDFRFWCAANGVELVREA